MSAGTTGLSDEPSSAVPSTIKTLVVFDAVVLDGASSNPALEAEHQAIKHYCGIMGQHWSFSLISVESLRKVDGCNPERWLFYRVLLYIYEESAEP